MPEHNENTSCLIKFTEIESKLKTHEDKFDDMKEMLNALHEMNQNVAVIANETQHQGKQLQQLFITIEKQGNEIQKIKDNTETKETVAKLADEVEELKMKDGKEAEKQLKQLKWLVISTLILSAMAVLWDRVFK